jgi:hypothetical protein
MRLQLLDICSRHGNDSQIQLAVNVDNNFEHSGYYGRVRAVRAAVASVIVMMVLFTLTRCDAFLQNSMQAGL